MLQMLSVTDFINLSKAYFSLLWVYVFDFLRCIIYPLHVWEATFAFSRIFITPLPNSKFEKCWMIIFIGYFSGSASLSNFISRI